MIFNPKFCNAFKATGEHLDIITTPYYSPFFSSGKYKCYERIKSIIFAKFVNNVKKFLLQPE